MYFLKVRAVSRLFSIRGYSLPSWHTRRQSMPTNLDIWCYMSQIKKTLRVTLKSFVYKSRSFWGLSSTQPFETLRVQSNRLFGAIAEYPTSLFTLGGTLWRTTQNTIEVILMQITGPGILQFSLLGFFMCLSRGLTLFCSSLFPIGIKNRRTTY